MKNKKTYYQIILDKSGSMYDCILTTVQGFNEQIQMIKKTSKKFPEQELLVSLTTFNHEIDFDIEFEKPSNVHEMTSEFEKNEYRGKIPYYPSGTTSLYDAIGLSVRKIQQLAKEEIERDEASVVVVIITDGHENSSSEFTYNQIQHMIKNLENSGNWTFSYLSNTPDAVNYAQSMNIKRENAMRYDKTVMRSTHSNLSHSIDGYMSSKERYLKEWKLKNNNK